MVGVLGRLFGLEPNGLSYGVVYALLAAATVAGAVYGYQVLLAMSRVLAIGMTALLARRSPSSPRPASSPVTTPPARRTR